MARSILLYFLPFGLAHSGLLETFSGAPQAPRQFETRSAALAHQFPFYAVFDYSVQVFPAARFPCGGTLIDNEFILTHTACCFCGQPLNITAYLNLFRMNSTNIASQADACTEKRVVVERNCMDPLASTSVDVPQNTSCLMRLETPSAFTPATMYDSSKMTITPRPNSNGATLYSMGFVDWNTTLNSNPRTFFDASTLQKSVIKVTNFTKCQEDFVATFHDDYQCDHDPEDVFYCNISSSDAFCADSRAGTGLAIFGDIGSPVIIKSNGKYIMSGFLAGVTGLNASMLYFQVDNPIFRAWAAPILASTKAPTGAPTRSPTTSKPTTLAPTRLPTSEPTVKPTRSPTTVKPTTSAPTRLPTTERPTRSPTTSKPTTDFPTRKPTSDPTVRPTKSPSEAPTTRAPSPTTRIPTVKPTRSPTTVRPTKSPSLRPTTREPTTKSPTTTRPTKSPSVRPTTREPTTKSPTTTRPTKSPSLHPTTRFPTTRSPVTDRPTKSPSSQPTTRFPTTHSPSNAPSTRSPTSARPTRQPTIGVAACFNSAFP